MRLQQLPVLVGRVEVSNSGSRVTGADAHDVLWRQVPLAARLALCSITITGSVRA